MSLKRHGLPRGQGHRGWGTLATAWDLSPGAGGLDRPREHNSLLESTFISDHCPARLACVLEMSLSSLERMRKGCECARKCAHMYVYLCVTVCEQVCVRCARVCACVCPVPVRGPCRQQCSCSHRPWTQCPHLFTCQQVSLASASTCCASVSPVPHSWGCCDYYMS